VTVKGSIKRIIKSKKKGKKYENMNNNEQIKLIKEVI
jgi:hypothetical protein